VNGWLVAATLNLLLLVPCLARALRGGVMDRLLGLQLGSVVLGFAFVMLAEGFGRSIYMDLALVFVVLSFVGNLLMVRFLERWL
jgi:multicomponent Na+:H+ antiporter subunit F